MDIEKKTSISKQSQERKSMGPLTDRPVIGNAEPEDMLRDSIRSESSLQKSLEEETQKEMPPAYQKEEDAVLSEKAESEYEIVDEATAEELKRKTTYRSKELQSGHQDMEVNSKKLKESRFRQKDENGNKVDNSVEMQAVKASLDELNAIWDEDVTDRMSENFEDAYNYALEKYNSVIKAAQTYASKRKWVFTPTGRKRREWVKKIKEQCEYERTRLRQAMSDSYELLVEDRLRENKENTRITFGDVLRLVRGDVILTQKKQLTSGSVAEVFTLEGHEEVFKKQEVVSNSYNFVKNKINRRLQNNDEEPDEGSLAAFTEVFWEITDKILVDAQNSEGKDNKTFDEIKRCLGDNILEIFYSTELEAYKMLDEGQYEPVGFVPGLDKLVLNLKEVWKNMPQDKMEEYMKAINSLVKEYFSKDSSEEGRKRRGELENELNSVHQDLRFIQIAKNNGINMGCIISDRNIATSRMAKLLNMEDLVIKCNNVILKNREQTMKAVSMEKAENISLSDFLEKTEGQEVSVTPEAAMNITRLLFLDIICGQTDRHENNIFVKYVENGPKSVTITGIKGIDNDFSFGGNIGKENIRNGYNRMAWLYNRDNTPAFKHIDQNTYELIMNLNSNKENVRFILADMGLDEKEYDALNERIETLCRYLREQKEKNADFIIDNDRLSKLKSVRELFDSDSRRAPKEEETDNYGCLFSFLYESGVTKIKEPKVQ